MSLKFFFSLFRIIFLLFHSTKILNEIRFLVIRFPITISRTIFWFVPVLVKFFFFFFFHRVICIVLFRHWAESLATKPQYDRAREVLSHHQSCWIIDLIRLVIAISTITNMVEERVWNPKTIISQLAHNSLVSLVLSLSMSVCLSLSVCVCALLNLERLSASTNHRRIWNDSSFQSFILIYVHILSIYDTGCHHTTKKSQSGSTCSLVS